MYVCTLMRREESDKVSSRRRKKNQNCPKMGPNKDKMSNFQCFPESLALSAVMKSSSKEGTGDAAYRNWAVLEEVNA